MNNQFQEINPTNSTNDIYMFLFLFLDHTIATGCNQAFYNNSMIKYKPKMFA